MGYKSGGMASKFPDRRNKDGSRYASRHTARAWSSQKEYGR